MVSRRLIIAIRVAFVVALIVIVIQLLRLYAYKQETGVLTVNTNQTNSLITISSNNHSAAEIGRGSARTRILPGTYLVVATNEGNTVYATAVIQKTKESSVSLDLNKSMLLPSPDNFTFDGSAELIDNGMTSDQIDDLRIRYFLFKQGVQSVSIVKNSVTPGPRNPDSNESFILRYDTLVDGTPYAASVTYGVGSGTRLELVNPQTGSIVYDSGPRIPDGATGD